MRMFSVLVDKAVKFREPPIPDKRLTWVNPPAANRLEEGLMEVFTLACADSDLEAAADLVTLMEKWQARRPDTDEAAMQLIASAKALENAGASLMVVELVPATVGKGITDALSIPVIGIGAGVHCSGQILNLYDMLDIYPGKKPRFVKNFMQGASSIADAIQRYVAEVKAGTYPAAEHSF